ncbi:MAG: hypothetical protein M0R22_07115 [Dehalococcoidia bacterium]|nr:hypothetical protein [Dehalococcoidia bacterium]
MTASAGRPNVTRTLMALIGTIVGLKAAARKSRAEDEEALDEGSRSRNVGID